ncbi:MAG TPA: signal peptidase I [Anaerolineae bacterium]|nr:signal peptidase I [Anaerolineae bacterium]
MQAEPQQTPQQSRSAFREVVETLLFTLLIYLLIRTFLFENYRVVGTSMVPTLADGQFLVVNKLGYRLHPPQRGDIIVFRDPFSSDRKLIKRVIGLPGDSVEIVGGQILINGQSLDEPYLADPGDTTRSATALAEEEYWVMGDNRDNSSDSRSWGTLVRARIVGKAWLSYWPPALWGLIPHETYGLVE